MNSFHPKNTKTNAVAEKANTLCNWLLLIGLCFSLGYYFHEANNKLDITQGSYEQGFKAGQNDCGGIDCTTFTLAIGQAAKEARQAQREQKTASVWEALDK